MDDFFSPVGSAGLSISQGYDTVSGLQYNFSNGTNVGAGSMLDFGSLNTTQLLTGTALQSLGAGVAVLGNPFVGIPIAAAGVAVQVDSFFPGAEYSPSGQAVIDGFNGASMGPQAPSGEPFMPYQADPVVSDWAFGGG